jgi:hypothetical protein
VSRLRMCQDRRQLGRDTQKSRTRVDGWNAGNRAPSLLSSSSCSGLALSALAPTRTRASGQGQPLRCAQVLDATFFRGRPALHAVFMQACCDASCVSRCRPPWLDAFRCRNETASDTPAADWLRASCSRSIGQSCRARHPSKQSAVLGASLRILLYEVRMCASYED